MSSSDWHYVTLDQLGTLSRGKSKHRPRNDSKLYGGRYPFVQTGDVKKAVLTVTNYSQTYNDLGLRQSKLWKAGTLMLTIAANIADSAILGMEACFPDSIIGFNAHPGESDNRFVKYLLDRSQKRIQAISKGTTQDNLSMDKLLTLKFRVPGYDEQTKIADAISSYDLLIECNQKQLNILEQVLDELYNEHFVRSRKTAGVSVRELVPLKEKVRFSRGRNISKDITSAGPVPVIAGGKKPAYYHNSANTTAPVVTISASGANAGYVALHYKDVWASDCSYIDARSTKHIFYYYLYLRNRQSEILRLQRGSAQPHVYPKDLESLQIEDIPDRLIDVFTALVRPYFTKMENLASQNDKLATARVNMLNVLMSGELTL